MSTVNSEAVREKPPYSTSPLLAQLDCVEHGFFGSRGGVSKGKYASLNCGHASLDASTRVSENRRRVAVCFGLQAARLHSVKQAHTNHVLILDTDSEEQFETIADGMVSKEPGVGLGALGADCAPVLFVDPVQRVIGAAHSGWKGALTGINEAVISAMQGLGARVGNIYAAIGPAMQQPHYEVQADFCSSFMQESPIDPSAWFCEIDHRHYFDTPGYIQARLRVAGVKEIDIIKEDTYSDPEHYFSYRRSCRENAGDYGRQIAVITLRGQA